MTNLLPVAVQNILTQYSKWIKLALSCLLLMLVLLLAWVSAQVAYTFLPQFSPNTENAWQVRFGQSGSKTQSEAAQLNAEWSNLHLFGEVAAEVEEVPEPVKAAPERPKMSIVVQGIFALANKKLSSAVLTTHGALTKVYGIGDQLANDVKLTDIQADHVVISRKGVKETIYLQKTSQKAKTPASKASVSKTSVKRVPTRLQQKLAERIPVENVNSITDLLTSNTRIKRQDVQDFYQYLAQIPESDLLSTVERAFEQDPAQAVRRLGLRAQANKGYLVTSRVPKYIIDAYNLRYGDRILSINGHDLGNPATDSQILNQVRSEGQASVKLQRGRQITTITVPVN